MNKTAGEAVSLINELKPRCDAKADGMPACAAAQALKGSGIGPARRTSIITMPARSRAISADMLLLTSAYSMLISSTFRTSEYYAETGRDREPEGQESALGVDFHRMRGEKLEERESGVTASSA